uniref:Rad50/SbcC-type AAA domain-containing protein n=1 Tax=Aureoumbra lagunensis TaxID=44058 RepID=A0A7S3JZ17_9STRA
MSMILKMNIQGVRAFDPEKAASIEFGSPLTMIVGTNGCGKTTIIECLKFALAGSYPPGGTEKGKNFVHDPRVSGLTEVKANVKLRFYAKTGDRYVVFRYMNVKQNKTRQTFTQLDGVLSKVGEDGRKKMSHKCSELDRAVPLLLGVSKSVLESVVFCHQEESNWPLDGPKELKARFDDIFASSRYTTALTVLKKKRNDLHKQEIECLGDLKGLAGRKKHADSIRKMLNDADNEVKKAQEKLELYAQAKQKLNDHLLKLENNLRALNKKKNSINELKRVEQELNRNLNHIRVTAGTDGIFSDEAMSDADLQGHIDELQEEDDVLGTELDELEQQKATLEEQITTKRKQISDIDLELGSLRGKLDERANTISSLEIYIKQYSDKQNAMADSAASLIEYDETGIEKELELNFNKAQRLLKKTQNERDTATGDVAAHVAKCSAALESYQNGAKEAISKAHQLEADIRDINRQIRDALGNKHYDLAELRSHVQHLEEDLKQIENNAKEQVQKCDQAFATIDTELQEIENEEPKLRRQLKDEEDHHKELEKVRGHSDEMSAAQALAEKSKNEFKNLYIKSVKDIKHPLDLLASSSIPGGASLADDFMMNQEPPLLNTAEDQSLDKFIDYAEKIDRYISVQLEKEFTRREADAMQIEAHAKAEVKAANDSLRKIKVKLEKEQSKFDGDDHPQDILKAKRTKAGTLMRTVQKLFEKMTKSENEDPDQEGAVAADEDLYAEFFKESDDILKKTDCHNMTKDFDSQDNISFAPLHDTLSWYRSFLMSLKGFIAQIKAETELVGKYKQARDKGKCALCRRKVNDDDQKKKLDKQISKLEKSKEYEHEINLYIAQCENEIQSLVELENGAFRIWVDSTKIIQEVAADKEKCMQEQAQIDEDKEKASADLEKIRSAKNKIKEIQIYSKRLADLATDAKNKMQSFERMQQRYPSSLSNISSSKSTAKTVNEAITNINNIRNQQTTNAERKATLHAQRAMAERERNEAQSKINQKREEYNQNRINLDKAIDLDSRRTQVQKQAEELSNPTDNSKAKERELKNAADEAEIKRQDVIKEHGLKCEEVQKKVYAAQHELDKFANLKEAAIQAKKESDSIAEKINDLNKTRAELAREVKSVEKEIKSVDECMQVAGVSDETRAKLRNKVNTTGEYRKLRNDINQRKVHIDQENEELILLASKVEKEIKKYEKVAHKYDFNKKQINDDDDDDDGDDVEMEEEDDDENALSTDPDQSKENLNLAIEKVKSQIQAVEANTNRTLGAKEQHIVIKRQKKKELMQDDFRDVDDKYLSKKQEHAALSHMCIDLDVFWNSVDKALQEYHATKIKKINDHIRELWQHTYRGEDIDLIEIVSGEEASSSRANRSYNYQVQMSKSGAMVDMRYRCSAGQRVLASIVIRLALAQEFGLNFGVLCLDEPTCNLDQANRESLAHGLVRLIALRSTQANFQLVVITHDEAFINLMRNELQVSAGGSLPEHFWRLSRQKKSVQ